MSVRCDPNLKDTEDLLDEYLSRRFVHENGNEMKIYAAAIDTGGHRTQAVIRFCKPRYGRRIYAIKGAKAVDAPAVNRKPSLNKYNTRSFQVGVNVLKDEFYANLAIEEPGPGYCHFPHRDDDHANVLFDDNGDGLYDKAYFEQLTVEVQDEAGRWVNPQRKRNEATDIRIYALAAYELCPRDVEKMESPLFHIETEQKRPKKRRRLRSRGIA